MRAPRPHIHVGSTTFYQGSARSQAEWESDTKRLLDEAHYFLAYDLARTALERFPDSMKLKQICAQALIRTGALDQAHAILDPLCAERAPGNDALLRAYGAIRRAMASTLPDSQEDPAPETLQAVQDLVRQIGLAGASAGRGALPDEETLGLLARVHKDMWRRTGRIEDARQARDTYLRAFQATGGHWTGINVATMSWLLGEQAEARQVAQGVLLRCQAALPDTDGEDRYWALATIGEASLLLGRPDEAMDAYAQAAQIRGHGYRHVVSSLQQLKLMAANGFPVPDELFGILRPPAVVIFVGHMLDRPEKPWSSFPERMESAIRRRIDRQLDKLDARIGYSSAANGADILFLEAMQDRGAEVNIVLPFETEDFIATSVRPAGDRWVSRFHKVLRAAESVAHVTAERYLGTEALFTFGAWVTEGTARLRARSLETTPYLLAVWDGREAAGPGGTAETIRDWPDKSRLRVIRLGGPSKSPTEVEAAAARPPAPGPSGGDVPLREIRTMLFADIVGYSQLEDEAIPFYMQTFLQTVSTHLRALREEPLYTNTWGDAIFVVMDRAMPLVEYALALRSVVCETDWEEHGLPGPMSIRIALHAGPVFVGHDPITGRNNFFGPHVNRAARIEPITVAGQIYASEQLVAMLTMEQGTRGRIARKRAEPFEPPFGCEYVGTVPLAKGFGDQAVYHIREQSMRGAASA